MCLAASAFPRGLDDRWFRKTRVNNESSNIENIFHAKLASEDVVGLKGHKIRFKLPGFRSELEETASKQAAFISIIRKDHVSFSMRENLCL